jgi:hypothetical protein
MCSRFPRNQKASPSARSSISRRERSRVRPSFMRSSGDSAKRRGLGRPSRSGGRGSRRVFRSASRFWPRGPLCALPDAIWRPLVTGFGYSVGFLMVVLSRQQLFTENTITVVLPVMKQFSLANLGRLGRLWSIVFAANMTGTLFAALLYLHTGADARIAPWNAGDQPSYDGERLERNVLQRHLGRLSNRGHGVARPKRRYRQVSCGDIDDI